MPTNAQLAYNINFSEEIECFCLSEFEWSQNLIIIAMHKKILLGQIKYKPDDEIQFELETIKEIHTEKRSNAIAISPQTSIQQNIEFCIANSDYNLMIYNTDLDKNTVQILTGHTNYINSIAWQPESEYIASVSDDHSCIVWNINNEYEKKVIFYLTSAGVCVKWHQDKEDKLLVAEKNGLIRFYNVKTEQAILSLETKKSPLMSIDWSISNSSLIAGIACGELLIWNINKPTIPIENKQIHEHGGMIVKFSINNEQLIATVGQPNMTLKIFCLKSNTLLMEAPLKLCGEFYWHSTLSYLVIAHDRKLKFFTVT